MRSTIASLLFLVLTLCEPDKDALPQVDSPDSSEVRTSVQETTLNPRCTTYTDLAAITVLTDTAYHRDSVYFDLRIENMTSNPYILCRDLLLSFPVYPILTPSVAVKQVTDSMNYLFDTLAPGEFTVKRFHLSRYAEFLPGTYSASILYTINAPAYKTEPLKGIRLCPFSLSITR